MSNNSRLKWSKIITCVLCVQSDVNWTQGKLGHFILKMMKCLKFSRYPLHLIMHGRVMVLECLVLYLLSLHILNHKPSCNEIAWIGGLWFKFTTLWIYSWTWEVICADNHCKNPLFALFVLCCSTVIPCINGWWATIHGWQCTIDGRQMSDRIHPWPVGHWCKLQQNVGKVEQNGSGNVQFCKQRLLRAKQRSFWPETEHVHLLFPKAEWWQHS